MDDKSRLSYIRTMITYDHDILRRLDAEAADRDDIQPFVEIESAKLLGLLIRLTGAKRVLELGSGIGYSTIWLGRALLETGGRLVTIDNHERTIKEVRRHIEEAGLTEMVDIRFGDAEVLLSEMAERGEIYDMIFQDCGKYVYDVVYEEIFSLLRPGGLLFTDDTLLQFDPAVRKGLGMHVDRYNRRLFSDDRYYSTMLPVGQGIALSVKRLDGGGAP